MDAKSNEAWREEARLSREQQAEIGDIFLSARTVSRQMVLQAREQSDEILRTARDRAEQIVTEAEERAERILREAEERAAAIGETRPNDASGMSAEMQDYVIRAVGECFEKLRLRQQENTEFINSQWQSFLSGLSLADTLPPPRRSRSRASRARRSPARRFRSASAPSPRSSWKSSGNKEQLFCIKPVQKSCSFYSAVTSAPASRKTCAMISA